MSTKSDDSTIATVSAVSNKQFTVTLTKDGSTNVELSAGSTVVTIPVTVTTPEPVKVLTHVTKDNFLDNFSLSGSATYDQNTGIATITPDTGYTSGSFYLKNKIDMNTSFTLAGKVNLGSHPDGADGIGLAFHTGNTTDVGNVDIGVGGLQNALGFKFDTYPNAFDSMPAPYGTFVDAGGDIDGTAQALSKSDIDGQLHDFTVDYDGDTRTLTIKYTQTNGNILTWTRTILSSNQAMAMIVKAITGGSTNLQQFEITRFDFAQALDIK